jgi:Tol biopolymer transport system component
MLVLAVPAAAAHLPILASQDIGPAYSPDGTHVAYTVIVNGQGRVFELDVVDAGTKRVKRIATNAGALSPTWSSDGRIAYSSGGLLYTANADGSGKRRYVAPTKAYAPAWRPHSDQLAYLTSHGATNLDLWVAGTLRAKAAIGKPAWSPDGTKLAFQRDGAIWVTTGPGAETKLATTNIEPGSPVWSPDGKNVAYAVAGRVYVVPGDGSAAPKQVAGPFQDVGPLDWAPPSDTLAYTVRDGVELSVNEPTWHSRLLVTGAGNGVSFNPQNSHGDVLAYSAPIPGCPGHLGIRIYDDRVIAGSCTILGTAGADVIEGTQSWGDVILAGAGNDKIHAGDRHTDHIDCGPGRDEVWADKVDKLSHCEIVHR